MDVEGCVRIGRREFIRRGLYAAAGAAGAAGAAVLSSRGILASAESAPSRKPNILFVFADQMRAASLGCLGNTDIKTPNMDRLASQGLLFSNCISTYPVCTPYRASLLTGRYGTTTGVAANGVELQDKETTIAEVLKPRGWRTGYIGKWHLEKVQTPFVPKSRRQGFDFWASLNNGGPHHNSLVYKDDPETAVRLEGYTPDAHTRIAVEFIEKNIQDPFCLFLSWGAPHPPYDPPEPYSCLYDPKKLKQRPNVKGEEYRETLAQYYGAISALDANIGKLMDALDRLGIAEDTIFCFTSDHGDMMGSQGRTGKNVPWEESINVPFILRYPHKVKAAKTDLLLGTTDIMPTLLGLCGAPVPAAVQGRDVSGSLLGKASSRPESVLLQRIIAGRDPSLGGIQEWRGVRTSRYTYARSKQRPWMLYDNQKDPYQMRNLAGLPEAKDVQARLDGQLQQWLKRIGDDFATSDQWRKRIRGHANPRVSREEE